MQTPNNNLWLLGGVLLAVTAKTLLGWWSSKERNEFNPKYLLDTIIGGFAGFYASALLLATTGTATDLFAGAVAAWAAQNASRTVLTKPIENLLKCKTS